MDHRVILLETPDWSAQAHSVSRLESLFEFGFHKRFAHGVQLVHTYAEAAAKAAAAAAREMSGHVTFTTTPDGKLHRSDSSDSGEGDQMSKLAKEGVNVWADVKADSKVQALLKEEIAPGFEALIRSAVEVVCELMSTLELPRVDGIYDSPLGSVCYHVDNLAFSEFIVAQDGLKVENQTGENGEQAGFGSTVSIDGIRTVMNDIHFAYCEFPKNW